MEIYDKIQDYNNVTIIFGDGNKNMGQLVFNNRGDYSFESVKIGVESIIYKADEETRYAELCKKREEMLRLEEFFNNLEPSDEKILEKYD